MYDKDVSKPLGPRKIEHKNTVNASTENAARTARLEKINIGEAGAALLGPAARAEKKTTVNDYVGGAKLNNNLLMQYMHGIDYRRSHRQSLHFTIRWLF